MAILLLQWQSRAVRVEYALLRALVNVCTQCIHSQIFLGNYPSKRFTEEGAQGHIAAFEKKLTGIEDKIKARNEGLDVPYIYMMPTKIPNSITI